MTFATLFNDWMILCAFLLAGYLLREFVPILQRIFLPAAVIGGFIALIGGPQVLGIWAVPKSFASYSSSLIILVMTCLMWGVNIDMKRIEGYVDYFCVIQGVKFAQIAVGALTGVLLCKIWPALPTGWGTMGIAAYLGGHGVVASYGAIFKDLGIPENMDLGMIMATIGLLCAVTVGMIIVNIGVRKGWCQYVKPGDKAQSVVEKGLLPKDKRAPIGTTRVPGSSINNLAFQFAMLMVVILVGKMLLQLCGTFIHPMFKKLPNYFYGIFGSLLIWPIMCKCKMQDYVDRKTCSTISGFCLEILIVGAIATLNLKLVSDFYIPILIHFVAITVATTLICLWYNYKITENEWFEKGIFIFGQATGSTPTGLALVRAIDPDSVATPGEAHAVAGAVGTPFFFWVPAVLPLLAVNMPWGEIGLGVLGTAIPLGLGWILFRKKMKALGR